MSSPFAPKEFPALPAVRGVRLAACNAGIRYSGREDLMIAVLAPGTSVAGVFTRSKTASASVHWCRRSLPFGQARGLVVNSGNANAFTGARGEATVRVTVESAAKAIGCAPDQIFVASTGVIGEPLAADIFSRYLGDLAKSAGEENWNEASRAIMTTDTYRKVATAKTVIDGLEVVINGIAKGSGMIAPDMATMLGFFFTDAAISATALQTICTEAVAQSFNSITVDSDTSTSDMVLIFATGAVKSHGAAPLSDPEDPRLEAFTKTLKGLMRELAHQIVKDGEGASKFVTIEVTGAKNNIAAKRIAFSIANSPLVKTALAGEDPNWGRIIMAVGKAGETADRDKIAIWFGKIRVAVGGQVDPAYEEQQAANYMKGSDILIRVDVGVGNGAETVWTCDLTHEYIRINADYRS